MCANYHINRKTNRPNICKAQSVDSCPLRENSSHFANKEEAKVYVENKLLKEILYFLAEIRKHLSEY